MTPRQRDLLAMFASERVRYVTIGGYAMRCHGFDRTTFDLDLWIESSAQNAAQIACVIEQLAPGHAPNGLQWSDVFQFEKCLVEYPSIGPGKEVDILTGLGEMDFHQCYARSTVFNVDGVSLRALCMEDLLQSKMLALRGGTDVRGRLRDQADHDQLRRFCG
ncbi:MAG: hypothetical protein AB7G08_31715 [Hyphomicrobiaceae bacterium]